jgi:chromosome segregation ATPase
MQWYMSSVWIRCAYAGCLWKGAAAKYDEHLRACPAKKYQEIVGKHEPPAQVEMLRRNLQEKESVVKDLILKLEVSQDTVAELRSKLEGAAEENANSKLKLSITTFTMQVCQEQLERQAAQLNKQCHEIENRDAEIADLRTCIAQVLTAYEDYKAKAKGHLDAARESWKETPSSKKRKVDIITVP